MQTPHCQNKTPSDGIDHTQRLNSVEHEKKRTTDRTPQTIYVVAYGEYKQPDKEYADGFCPVWCEGVALGAFTNQETAEAFAIASERGYVTPVKIDTISEHHQKIIDGLKHTQQRPSLFQHRTRSDQIKNLAALLNENMTTPHKSRIMVAEEIISAIEQRVKAETEQN